MKFQLNILAVALCLTAFTTAPIHAKPEKLKSKKAKASTILDAESCQAVSGMVSKVEGVMSCTVPIMTGLGNESRKGVDICTGGELISGGTFCRIVIDTARKKAIPNCDKVETEKTESVDAYMEWQMNVKRPHTDAWKCAKLNK